MNNTSTLTSTDTSRFDDAYDDIIWDPRADMDDDGDVDSNDQTLYDAKLADWGGVPSVDPRQAFSDVDNPFMFQGVPHFALDTASNATGGKLMLNHHRARFADPVTGRWVTRDPLLYFPIIPKFPKMPWESLDQAEQVLPELAIQEYSNHYLYLDNSPSTKQDPGGLICVPVTSIGCTRCFVEEYCGSPDAGTGSRTCRVARNTCPVGIGAAVGTVWPRPSTFAGMPGSGGPVWLYMDFLSCPVCFCCTLAPPAAGFAPCTFVNWRWRGPTDPRP